MTEFLQIIAAFLGSLGFGILYNIRGKKLILAGFGGLIGWAFFLALGLLIDTELIRFCIVSMIISIYAEILARVLKTPTTTFITTSLIPLVPGRALYYTMSSVFGGDINTFFGNVMYTLSVAFAIAIGVVIVAASVRLGSRLKTLQQSKVNK